MIFGLKPKPLIEWSHLRPRDTEWFQNRGNTNPNQYAYITELKSWPIYCCKQCGTMILGTTNHHQCTEPPITEDNQPWYTTDPNDPSGMIPR